MAASHVPTTDEAWKMLEAWARAFFGKTSETSAAATAHSPPTPMATRKRSAVTCQRSVAKKVRAEKTEYIRIVTIMMERRP